MVLVAARPAVCIVAADGNCIAKGLCVTLMCGTETLRWSTLPYALEID